MGCVMKIVCPKITKDMTNRVKELERVITALDTLYQAGELCVHPDSGEDVSDSDYDEMREELRRLSPRSKVLRSVTASILVSDANVVKHDPPMSSISKVIGSLKKKRKALRKWMWKTEDELHDVDYVMSYKRDGVACALYMVIFPSRG